MFTVHHVSLFCLTFLFIHVTAFYPKEVKVRDGAFAERWWQALDEINQISYPQLPQVVQFLSNLGHVNYLSEQCKQTLSYLSRDLINYKVNALKFLDASSKGSHEFAFGRVAANGNRKECLAIAYENRDIEFRGRYVQLQVNLPQETKYEHDGLYNQYLDVSEQSDTVNGTSHAIYADFFDYFNTHGFSFAICVPSKCKRDDIVKIVENEVKFKHAHIVVHNKTPSKDEFTLSVKGHVFLSIVASLVVTVLISNLFCNQTHWFHKSLSFERNLQFLVQDVKNDVHRRLIPIDGLRAQFQILAAAVHVWYFRYHSSSDYPWFSAKRREVPLILTVMYRFNIVSQILLTVSGFMAVLSAYSTLVKLGRLPFKPYLWDRVIRILPTLGVSVILHSLYWQFVDYPSENMYGVNQACEDNWWQTLLMVNTLGLNQSQMVIIKPGP